MGTLLGELMEGTAQYFCGWLKSIQGHTTGRRVEEVRAELAPYSDIQVIFLTKKVNFYSSKSRENVDKPLPVLYDYVFIKTHHRTRAELQSILGELGIELLDGNLSGRDIRWLEERLKTKDVPLDLTALGTGIGVGELVRVVNGPYVGNLATVVEIRPGDIYIIELGGIRLTAGKHSIRRPEYDATDDDYSTISEEIR